MDIIGKDALSIDVGQRLRSLREERNVSMRALARRSGLSANALSMIERGLTSPSVTTLHKLAGALEVPVTAFFRQEPPRSRIVYRKANQRVRIALPKGVYEGLGGEAFSGRVEPFMLTLENGGTSGQGNGMIHSGHEFVFVLRGKLEYVVDDQVFLLEAGDSLLFAARLPHRWYNPGPSVANAIVVLAGFEETERPSEYHYSNSTIAAVAQAEQ
ncbi:MAG TPA: cupin domain-containing protein [Anaerolineaceae bacterium]|nr:cupin domain-containing protein [Anaerolineaceae bacterium]